MINFFHRLFNYHCADCKEEDEVAKECKSCDILRYQLELVNKEKERLLLHLLDKDKPAAVLADTSNFQPTNKTLPWTARRQLLEAEDKRTAQLLRDKEKEAINLRTAVAKDTSAESRGQKFTGIIGEKSIDESISELEKELGVDYGNEHRIQENG